MFEVSQREKIRVKGAGGSCDGSRSVRGSRSQRDISCYLVPATLFDDCLGMVQEDCSSDSVQREASWKAGRPGGGKWSSMRHRDTRISQLGQKRLNLRKSGGGTLLRGKRPLSQAARGENDQPRQRKNCYGRSMRMGLKDLLYLDNFLEVH